MSANRDELHRLVDELPEEEVAAALRLVHRPPERAERPWPPRWFGMGSTTETDLSERVDELLKDGFGQ
jgi:hypothetical protein